MRGGRAPGCGAGGQSVAGHRRFAAEFVQLVPVPPASARVASSFSVTEVAEVSPVSVLTVRSRVTPRFTVWSGVMRQEQQAISSRPD